MALAEYYNRGALAAAQVIAGFNEPVFRAALEKAPVGLSFDREAIERPTGQSLLDLAVRLLARLYPTLTIHPAAGAEVYAVQLRELAQAINPQIAIADTAPVGIAVGANPPQFERTIFAGADGWTARLSVSSAQRLDDSSLPFGAGAAACLAAAQIFRGVLLDQPQSEEVSFSCLQGHRPIVAPDEPTDGWTLPVPAVLVGCGAIGQAALWALARSPLLGSIHLVDDEPVELSNLQRYVLTRRTDEGASKAELAQEHLTAGLTGQPFEGDWAAFTAKHGYDWSQALVAVDSAAARRAVQATLPRWIANAWTQPGDLGVSTHSFLDGACLACLYLPSGKAANEDVLIATSLGIPEHVADVRTLLHHNAPTPPALLDVIANKLQADRGLLDSFSQVPIRRLYTEGICGGAVMPLGQAGAPSQDVHVPLAHQSALAGVLLAARLLRHMIGLDTEQTEVTRIDVLRDPPAEPTQLAQKDPRKICFCQDVDYQTSYRRKY